MSQLEICVYSWLDLNPHSCCNDAGLIYVSDSLEVKDNNNNDNNNNNYNNNNKLWLK